MLASDHWADNIARAYDMGLGGYLTKPITREALDAALDKVGLHQAPARGTRLLPPTPLLPARTLPEPIPVAEAGASLASRERMLKRVAGDEALLHAMAKAFCTDLRDRMGQVHAALQQQDWAAVRAQAHALKGALLTMTAQAAAHEAKALEQAAQAQDTTGTQEAFARLSLAAKVAFDTVKTW